MTQNLQQPHIVVECGAASDAGAVRTLNEDSYLAATPVFVVADGMGGHLHGELASVAVVHRFQEMAGRHWATADDIHRAVLRATQDIVALGRGPASAGSTVTGVALTVRAGRPAWLVFNVGDSRVYLVRQGRLTQVTVDHSKVQELKDAGHVAESKQVGRNVITRAIGGGRAGVPPVDQWTIDVEPGDRMLICSDGLSGELTDALIGATLLAHADPQSAASALVAAAIESGGRDNVTALVVSAVEVAEGTCEPGVDEDTVEDDQVLADLAALTTEDAPLTDNTVPTVEEDPVPTAAPATIDDTSTEEAS